MKKLTILMALLLLAACNPKRNSTQARVSTLAGSTSTQCVSNGIASVGSIYDNQNPFNFENQVKALLSATISPFDVGSINPQMYQQTGVEFKGVVKLDSGGNVIGAQSNVTVEVKDSIWSMNKVDSNLIRLIFDQAKGSTITGRFNTSNGDDFLSLSDKYGEIRFQGRLDAQNFSGTVNFQNATNVAGGSPASGTLGQFTIQRCAILQ